MTEEAINQRLCLAAINGDYLTVRTLMWCANLDATYNKHTALYWAIYNSAPNLEIVKLLIEYGADIPRDLDFDKITDESTKLILYLANGESSIYTGNYTGKPFTITEDLFGMFLDKVLANLDDGLDYTTILPQYQSILPDKLYNLVYSLVYNPKPETSTELVGCVEI